MKFGASSPAGGSFPRQFSWNDRGDLATAGLQMIGRVTIQWEMREDGGVGNKVLTRYEGLGKVTSVFLGVSRRWVIIDRVGGCMRLEDVTTRTAD